MANPYDKFDITPADAPPTASVAAAQPNLTPTVSSPGAPPTVLRVAPATNPYTQFDTIAPPAGTPPMVPSGPPPTPATPGYLGPVVDLAKNIGTGFEQAGADIAGLPAAFNQWISKYIPPDPGSFQANPNQPPPRWWPRGLPLNPPTTPQAMQAITSQTGLNYMPSTPEGRIVQRAAEFGGGGLLGGPLAATFAAGGGAAQQAGQELGTPDWFNTTLGIVAPILAHAGVSTARALLQPTTEAGQMAAAGKVLNEVATDPNAPINPPPIPGAPQSLGQATGDPGLLAFEQHRFQSSDPMKTQFGQIKQGANQAASDTLNTVGNFPNRAEAGPQALTASAGMQQQTQAGLNAAQNAEHTAWTGLDPTNQTAFDTLELKQNANNYVNGLTKARQQYVPSNAMTMIQNLNPTEPLMELQDLRSTLSTQARDLRAANNNNQANVVEGLRDVVANHIDNMTMPTPDLATAYENARLLTQQLHQTYDDPLIQRVLNSPTGSTTAGNTFMSTPEGFDAYYKATGGSPQAIQHAQDYFLAGLAQKSLGTGDQMIPNSFTAYLNKPANQALLNDRRLFTQDQADAINQVAAQLDHTAQTERAAQQMGGSQTYRLLAGQQQAEALVGKPAAVASDILTKAKVGAGAWLGSHFGPVGSVIGGLTQMIGKAPYTEAGQKVLSYIDQALADPAFAAQLRNQPPLPSPTSTLAPALKATAVPVLLGGPR